MLNIPFYSNTKDNTHCLQACLKSLLKFYFPKYNYSFNYLDRVTAHKKGLWTWNNALIIFLCDLGFDVKYIVKFDFKKFAKKGKKYLQEIWTDEVYQLQDKYSDFFQEQKLTKKLINEKRVTIKNRPASAKDLRRLFSLGFIIFVPINSCVLDSRNGYLSHLVLITDISNNLISFHDPGLPAQKNRRVSMKIFLKAMKYPNRETASIIATKLIEK